MYEGKQTQVGMESISGMHNTTRSNSHCLHAYRTGRLHDLFRTAGVIGDEVGHVVDIATVGHPHGFAILPIVVGHLLGGEDGPFGFGGSIGADPKVAAGDGRSSGRR